MQKWKTPVEITIADAGRQTVHGPFAAAMMLSIVWPVRKGRWRDEAERLCIAAAEGNASDEEARRAFIAAVREAGIALEGETHDEDPIVLGEPHVAGLAGQTGSTFATGLQP